MIQFLTLISLVFACLGFELPLESIHFKNQAEKDVQAIQLWNSESFLSILDPDLRLQDATNSLWQNETSHDEFQDITFLLPSSNSFPIWGWVKKQATKIWKGAKKVWSTAKSNVANIIDPYQLRRVFKRLADKVIHEVNVLWREWRYDRYIEEPNWNKPVSSTRGFSGDPIIYINGVNTTSEEAIEVANRLATNHQRPVWILYNMSNEIFVDGLETIRDKLWFYPMDQHNPTTRQLAHVLLNSKGKLSIVTHSQGSVIAINAMSIAENFDRMGWMRSNVRWVACGHPLSEIGDFNPKRFVDKFTEIIDPTDVIVGLVQDPIQTGLYVSPLIATLDLTAESHSMLDNYTDQVKRSYLWPAGHTRPVNIATRNSQQSTRKLKIANSTNEKIRCKVKCRTWFAERITKKEFEVTVPKGQSVEFDHACQVVSIEATGLISGAIENQEELKLVPEKKYFARAPEFYTQNIQFLDRESHHDKVIAVSKIGGEETIWFGDQPANSRVVTSKTLFCWTVGGIYRFFRCVPSEENEKEALSAPHIDNKSDLDRFIICTELDNNGRLIVFPIFAKGDVWSKTKGGSWTKWTSLEEPTNSEPSFGWDIGKLNQDLDGNKTNPAETPSESDHQNAGGPGTLGISVEFLSEERVLRVTSVSSGYPASKAGINVGDKIISIDGQSFDAIEFHRLMMRSKGKRLTLVVSPSTSPGSSRDIYVTPVQEN